MQEICSDLQKNIDALKSSKQDFDVSLATLLPLSGQGPKNPEAKQAVDKAWDIKVELEKQISDLESQLHVSLKQAQEIMEKEGYEGFLGPEAINQAFDIKLSLDQIPPITFTQEQLERARALGQILVLRIDKVKDQQGKPQPLNAAQIVEISNGHNIKLRDNDDWLSTDQGTQEPGVTAIKDQTPRSEWVLVSRDLLPDTKNKNYLEQTAILINYLKVKIFSGQDLPQPYQEAIQEFEQTKKAHPDLAKLTVSQTSEEWKKAAKILSELKITQLLRRSPVEILYDLYLYKVRYDKYLLAGTNYDWSSECYSVGGLINLGNFDFGGIGASHTRPGGYSYIFGASVSCRSFPFQSSNK